MRLHSCLLNKVNTVPLQTGLQQDPFLVSASSMTGRFFDPASFGENLLGKQNDHRRATFSGMMRKNRALTIYTKRSVWRSRVQFTGPKAIMFLFLKVTNQF